jgi:hypothetical protein
MRIEAANRPKIGAYCAIVASTAIHRRCGVDDLSFRVLVATTGEKRLRNMMEAVESIARNGRSTMFRSACRPDLALVQPRAAFREPWRRVGNAGLLVAQRNDRSRYCRAFTTIAQRA